MIFHLLGTLFLLALSFSLSLASGPLISSLLLFFVPAFLLGTLSPYAIKLQTLQVPEQGIGSVSGKIFFCSTLGSIIGSLLAGFYLIPNFGVNEIFIVTGAVFFVPGFIPLFILGSSKKYLVPLVFLVATVIIITDSISRMIDEQFLYSGDGIYEKIVILDTEIDGRPARMLMQDRNMSGAIFLDTDDPSDHAFEYSKYFSVYEVFNPDIKNALIIGAGPYTLPKVFLSEFPDATIEVVDIEPSLIGLSKEYFGLEDSPRLKDYNEDGRRFLQNSNTEYDYIFGDAYLSFFSIPSHLATQEFFRLAKSKLSPNGIFVANVIGDLTLAEKSLAFSEMRTFMSVFENSYFFATEENNQLETQNMIFVGYNSDKEIDFNSDFIMQSENKTLRSLPNKLIDVDQFDLSPYPILTDNYAPVEHLTSEVLKRSGN